MKVLFVGDLHLYDRELSTTKRMRENNIEILKGIYEYLKNNEEIKLCVFEGDIQHKTPTSKGALYEISKWKYWLRKIGDLMSERSPKLVIVQREGVDKDRLHKMPANLFTLQGNHDMATELRSMNQNVDYTLFDDLLFEGILQNPRGVCFKDSGKLYYIQLNNYGEADAPVPKQILDKGNFNIVKVFHDTIDVPEQENWVRIGGSKGVYKGSDVLVDAQLGIAGHIHNYLAPSVVDTVDGKSAVFVQTGSLGRTSASEMNMRDHGYCTVLDTTDGLDVIQVQIPLIDVDEYFDWARIMLNNQQKESLKNSQNFNIALGDYERKHFDPKEDIKEMDIPEDVKENCLKTLESLE